MSTRWEVTVEMEDGRKATMTSGPRCQSDFCESVARRHAKEYTEQWHRRAWAHPKDAWLVHCRPMRIELPAPRDGRPGYRWAQGYVMTDPTNGNEVYPPVRRHELYDLARGMFGDDCKLIFEKEKS